MMMCVLFSKESSEKVHEIDYKADFPSDLAKIIIAFANTAGGVILIGIRADMKTNMPEEIVGIPLRDGLEEQVIDIAMSNIRPPISPEVKACPFKSQDGLAENDKAVVIVRVSESELAPHSHARNNVIWVRNQNKCDLASLEAIEQLLMKRDESDEVREEMLEEMPALVYKGVKAVCPEKEGHKRYYQICVSPSYPAKAVVFDRAMDDFLREQIESVGHVFTSTPRIGGIDFEASRTSEGLAHRFFTVTRHGLIIFVAPLELSKNGGVYVERVIQSLAKMLRAYPKVLERIGYFGKVSIQVAVSGVEGSKFETIIEDVRDLDEYHCQEVNIELEEERSLDEIKDNEKAALYSFYNSILRSFKMSYEERILRERLDWLLRHLP
jgi:hypothetical protein